MHLQYVLLFCRTCALGNMHAIDHKSSSLIHEAVILYYALIPLSGIAAEFKHAVQAQRVHAAN